MVKYKSVMSWEEYCKLHEQELDEVIERIEEDKKRKAKKEKENGK